MVWDDYDRDWKNTQRQFAQLETEVTQAQLDRRRGVDRNKLQQLEAQRPAGGEERSAANQQKVDDLQAKLAEADASLFRATLDYQFTKATYDSGSLRLRSASARRCPSAASAKQERADEEAQRRRAERWRWRRSRPTRPQRSSELGKYTGEVGDRRRSRSRS